MNKKHSVFLSAPHHEGNAELTKIIAGRLKRLGREKQTQPKEDEIYWPAAFFQLHRSRLFHQASAEQKQNILALCNQNLLLESYFIEKLGITYCAKMVLNAENVETAQAYSLIGADETTHLRWLTPFIPTTLRTTPMGSFLFFLAQLLDQGDSYGLVYLLQVILEGWGIEHYRTLARYCTSSDLKQILQAIVRDEALHHHAGLALFQPQQMSKTQYDFIQENLVQFLQMIRVGPQAVVHAVATVLGGLSKSEKMSLLKELASVDITNQKLKAVKYLMMIPGCEGLIATLEELKLFSARRIEECV